MTVDVTRKPVTDRGGAPLARGDRVLVEYEVEWVYEFGTETQLTLRVADGPPGVNFPRLFCHGSLVVRLGRPTEEEKGGGG
jgi:hypothetical protein